MVERNRDWLSFEPAPTPCGVMSSAQFPRGVSVMALVAAVRRVLGRLVARLRRGESPVRGRGSPVDAPAEASAEPAEPSGPADDSEALDQVGMTPEEVVLELLEEQDDRLRQQRVVELTGWSEATTSRVLMQLEEEGTLTRIKVGREKVVCLSGQAPEPETRPNLDS
jgi:uncharacterized membrane protein